MRVRTFHRSLDSDNVVCKIGEGKETIGTKMLLAHA